MTMTECNHALDSKIEPKIICSLPNFPFSAQRTTLRWVSNKYINLLCTSTSPPHTKLHARHCSWSGEVMTNLPLHSRGSSANKTNGREQARSVWNIRRMESVHKVLKYLWQPNYCMKSHVYKHHYQTVRTLFSRMVESAEITVFPDT